MMENVLERRERDRDGRSNFKICIYFTGRQFDIVLIRKLHAVVVRNFIGKNTLHLFVP